MAVYSKDFLRDLPGEAHLAGFEICKTFLDYLLNSGDQDELNAILEFYAMYAEFLDAYDLDWELPGVEADNREMLVRRFKEFAVARKEQFERRRLTAQDLALLGVFRKEFRAAMGSAVPAKSLGVNRKHRLIDLRRIPTWTHLNSLGRNKILKSSYVWIVVVPVVAKLFSVLEETLTFTILNAEITLKFALPFSWQMLYLSAVFFGIGSLIYSRFCPEIVAKYDSLSDFTAEGKGIKQLRESFLKVTPEGASTPSYRRVSDLEVLH